MRVHIDRYSPVGRMFADRYCRTDDRIVFPPAQGASSLVHSLKVRQVVITGCDAFNYAFWLEGMR